MRFLGIVLCLIGLGLTAYSAVAIKAPAIETDIGARAEDAVAALAAEAVDVSVDGRFVTLRGTAPGEGQKAELLRTAEVRGGLGPIDAIELPPVVSPYPFAASKDGTGKVIVEGAAPDPDLRALLIADATSIFGDAARIDVMVARGVPPGDWRRAVGSAMDALAAMERGRLRIADQKASLEGEVETAADAKAVAMFTAMAPDNYTWSTDLAVRRPVVEPFTLVVQRDAGGLTIKGFAPDDETRAAMIEQAKQAAGRLPVVADIQIADGMPDDAWPDLVYAGIGAMAQVRAGRIDVSDNDVTFSGDLETGIPADAAILPHAPSRPRAGAGPADDGAAADPDARPAADRGPRADAMPGEDEAAVASVDRGGYVTTLDKTSEGGWTLLGAAPDAAARDAVLAAVEARSGEDAVEADLALADGAPHADWQDFIIERLVALDAVKAGRLIFEGDQVHLIGVVDTIEDAAAARAKLAAIDSGITSDLAPIDPRPAARIDLALSPRAVVRLAGMLPEGLSADDAAHDLGLKRHEGRLVPSGRGDVEAWRRDLRTLAGFLPEFEAVKIRLGDRRLGIEGTVPAHGDADQTARRLRAALGDARTPTIDVETSDVAYADGTRRINPLTGVPEEYDRGHWLPVVEVAADLQACREQSSRILAANEITFLRGAATLDAGAEQVIDQLAAIAVDCLNNDALLLEIGGHTDSRGAKVMNQRLSQARAEAVLRALQERGVGGPALTATGYGDSRPVADNASGAGRAKNRRISFEWTTAGDG